MITVYLDHQIYSYLKNKDDSRYFNDLINPGKRQLINRLENFLKKNKELFLIFYSHAHLLDLSNDKSGNIERLKADLLYRENWAQDNFLIYREKEKATDYCLIKPLDAFEPFFEQSNSKYDIDFASMFDLNQYRDVIDPKQFDELQKQLDIIRDIPAPNWDDMLPKDISSEEAEKLKTALPLFNIQGSFIDYLNKSVQFLKEFEENDSIYRSLRKVVKDGIEKIRNDNSLAQYSRDSSYIVDIASLDLSSTEKSKYVNEKLLKVVKKQLSDRDNHNPSQFELHYQSYFSLDIMNIEVENKLKTKNMLYDGQHSFYGGHCEIVVSDDKMFREKSKLIYKMFGLSTQVYSIEEFLTQSFVLDMNSIITIEDFHNRIGFDLKNGMIKKSSLSNIHTFIQEVKLSTNYFYYFNQMLMVNEYGQDFFVFRHNCNTYLKHLPYRIVQNVCNKSYQIFGIDANGRSLYNWETENLSINNDSWEGRYWKYTNIDIILQYNKSHSCLQLVIGGF